MKKPKIIKKAYAVRLSRLINFGPIQPLIIYADNTADARKQAWDMLPDLGETFMDSFKPRKVTSKNLPIIRSHMHDIFTYNGVRVSRYKLDDIIRLEDRIDKLDKAIANPEITHCALISTEKNLYLEGPRQYMGFTDDVIKAHIYRLDESFKRDYISNHADNSNIKLAFINRVKYNNLLAEKINNLRSKYL